MSEIGALPKAGITVASTFSGAGGSCLGYRMAGFEVVWASEFIPEAQETYRHNFPDTHLDPRDIRNVPVEDIFQTTGLKEGELDLFDGSPPCDPFSISGKREEKWGLVKTYSSKKQRTDDLSFEFVRLLSGLRPKVFVMENVAGLIIGSAKGYFKEILLKLKNCGYRVKVRLLDAQWLGVPQARQRTIFIGVREDLGIDPVFPKPFHYRYTFRDALAGRDAIEGESYIPSAKTKLRKFYNWTVLHEKFEFKEASEALFGVMAMFNHKRISYDKPCPTVMQGSRHLYHPKILRTLTLLELKRVASFPEDFFFTGSYNHAWERIGNCVPPLMMKAVAEVLRDSVFTRIKGRNTVKT